MLKHNLRMRVQSRAVAADGTRSVPATINETQVFPTFLLPSDRTVKLLMTGESDNRSQSTSSTASSLIRRVQSRDPDAWRRLTELYGPLVYHWCRRHGLNEADASDVFQDVFVTVNRVVDRFDPHSGNGTFRGWLWTITQSRVRDHWRRRAGRESAVGGTNAQLDMAALPDPFDDQSADPSDRSETASLFHRALRLIEAEFEPRTWQAFWRAVVEEQETSQIAADLDMSTSSVRQAKSRVLRRLRHELGDG